MIRNLTPHAINVLIAELRLELAPDARPARLRQDESAAGWVELDGAAVELFDIGADVVQDLPAPLPDVWLVVARVVAMACPDRRDLVFPYREVRDNAGRVIACSALGRVAREDR